jgi:hypothetical protein
LLVVLVATSSISLFGEQTASASFVVHAGDFDRHNTIVEVDFKNGARGDSSKIADILGPALPLQMLDEHRGVFILPDLKAHKTRTFELQQRPVGQEKWPVSATEQGGKVIIDIGGHPVLTYQGDKTDPPAGYDPAYKRGGYLYPVLTPSGLNVTDDYPANHKHHHGIWSPWTKTEFEGRHPDFWNMGDKTGTVEPVDFGQEFWGAVCGGFTARHRMVDLSAQPEPKDVLDETWQVVAYDCGPHASEPYFIFDLTITQTCASSSPLTLEKYRYGGLGFRGAKQWGGENGCEVLTSEGKTRANGNESRGRWVRYSGLIDGKPASLAIFNAPDDFRFPQPMRIFPDQPFFCYAPEQLGEFQIVPGKRFVQRYRFIVADGVISADELNRLWNDYGHPPTVQVQ